MKIGLGRSSQEITDKAQAFTRQVSGKHGHHMQVIEDDQEIYVHVANGRASVIVTYDRCTGDYRGTASSRP